MRKNQPNQHPSVLRLRLAFAARCAVTGLLLGWFGATAAYAGGPKFVAGSTYFNSGLMGTPVVWKNGLLNYYVDQGALSSYLTNAQAKAMVDQAAAEWSVVTTAAVKLTDAGTLSEDVSGANLVLTNGVITAPVDVAPTATQFPVAVIFDADGSVINSIFGTGASSTSDCINNVLFNWLDNLNTDATIAHGVILLNGLCVTNAAMQAAMQAQLVRAFGRMLGLDSAEVDNAGANATGPNYAIMQPPPGVFSTGLTPLLYDDVASLNRLYPVTSANIGSFTGKVLTAANTITITGTISFKNGVGMQGVNVVARPLDSNGNPMNQYGVSFVTGGYYRGTRGNPMIGYTDDNGNPLTNYGSTNANLQGYFDLTGIPLPPGVTTATYQISFEQLGANEVLNQAVGPYYYGSPVPSGSMPTVTLTSLCAGTAQTVTKVIQDSASSTGTQGMTTAANPAPLPSDGMWVAGINQVGQTHWFEFPVRGGRAFTIVAQPLNESGTATAQKLLPSIGVWDAYDSVTAAPVVAMAGPDGNSAGETWLQVTANSDDIVRLAIADQRGDGRPDYLYNGWVLYADTVVPENIPSTGGPIAINGFGFHPNDTVLVNGVVATVTSVTPTQILAVAPAAATGVTGSVDVEVDDSAIYSASAIISGGVSYDAGTGYNLHLNTAPMGTVPIGLPMPFAVTAEDVSLNGAAGVTVTYTVNAGTAKLGCGQTVCTVTTTGDGYAVMNVTDVDTNASVVTASLNNGANVQAHFSGGATPATVSALNGNLSLAAGATFSWPVQMILLSNGAPASGFTVNWSPGAGTTISGSPASVSNTSGLATMTLTVGPLTEGQTSTTTACVSGTSYCASFVAFGARPEYAAVEAISGTNQLLAQTGTPSQIFLRVLDMDGNRMVGASVTLYQTLYSWTPPCLPHEVCVMGDLLARNVTTATSGIDGSVSFNPLTIAGTATEMVGVAVTGNSSSMAVLIDQIP